MKTFTTIDHPEANGRTAQPGDEEFFMTFPLENGETLKVRMGRSGFEGVSQNILDMLTKAPTTD